MNLRAFLSRFRRLDITNAAGSVFMVRYYLARTPWFSVYLHEIRRSDEDLCLHDHPWHFVSFILAGGYVEQLRTGRHPRRPGQLLYRPARTAHRIEIPGPTAWTLVIASRKHRPWGFFTPQGWRRWFPGQMRPICE